MPEEKKYEESMILALLAKDSEYAFQLVFDRYRNRIYKLASLYVKSPAIAEEIVQDVFLKLWFYRKDQNTIRHLEPWLFSVCRNCTINYLHKIAGEWRVREQYTLHKTKQTEDTDHKIRSAQYEQLLHEAIARLPHQQRQVFTMAKEQGLSYGKIGDALSLSPLTVKTHMSRALHSVKKYFIQHGEILFLAFLLSMYSEGLSTLVLPL